MARPIIYIHTTDLGANDTSTTFVLYNAVSLAQGGAKVFLVLINSSDQDPYELVSAFVESEALPETLQVVGFRHRSRSKFRFYLFARSYVREFPQPALVINRAHGVAPYLLFQRDRRHVYLFETHDFFYDLTIRDDVQGKAMRRKSRIERRHFKHLDGMICLNEHQKRLYKERLPDMAIGVFPTGIHQLPTLEKERKDRVVYIGSLDWRLGTNALQRLMEVWPDDIELFIIGGKRESEIAAFKEGVSSTSQNIVFTGWIDKLAIHDILKEAKVALMPHEDVFFNRYLTVPLKMFDYFAYGLPILATDLPAIRDWITEGKEGYFMNWQDEKAVIQMVKELLKQETHWKEMSDVVIDKALAMLWSKRAAGQLRYFEEMGWR